MANVVPFVALADQKMELESVAVGEIPDTGLVANLAGGLVYQVDDMTRLRRFLILGSDAANYYVSPATLAVENAVVVKSLVEGEQGLAAVEEIVRISRAGRAPKQSPGIFALAMAVRFGTPAVRKAALDAVVLVCRTGSTLFEFVQYCKDLGQGGDDGSKKPSWGRAMRRAIARWYLSKAPRDVAYQVTKYSQRSGWSHADLLRLAHPNPSDVAKFTKAPAAEASVNPTTEAGAEAGDAAVDAGEAVKPPATISTTTTDAAATDFRLLFDFITNNGRVRPESKALAGKAAQPGPDGATPGAITSTTQEAAIAGTAVEMAGAAADPQVSTSAVLQYLQDAERLRKGLHLPPPPPTPTQLEARELLRRFTAAAKPSQQGEEGAKAQKKRARSDDPSPRDRFVRGRGPSGMPFMLPAAGYGSDSDTDEGHRYQRYEPHMAAARWAAAQAEEAARAAAKAARAAVKAAAAQARLEPSQSPEWQAARDGVVDEACALIKKHRFGHEHVGDTSLLSMPKIWSTFLEVGMPMTALVRNLGRLTALGVLDVAPGGGAGSEAGSCLARVTGQLRSPKAVQAARLHPLVLLEALQTYRAGEGDKGSLRWRPVRAVEEALEDAFYLAFKNVQPTGRRFLLGIDVSGSMGGTECAGMRNLDARQAAAAMSMAFLKAEPSVTPMAFTDEFVPLAITKDMKLDKVMKMMASLPFGATDCAQPMLYALEHKIPVDVFVVMTDNETWAGDVQPADALRRYRAEMGIPARMVVLAFSSTGFSIADPSDGGMLDVAGLDSGVPQVVAEFVAGQV